MGLLLFTLAKVVLAALQNYPSRFQLKPHLKKSLFALLNERESQVVGLNMTKRLFEDNNDISVAVPNLVRILISPGLTGTLIRETCSLLLAICKKYPSAARAAASFNDLHGRLQDYSEWPQNANFRNLLIQFSNTV